MRIFWKIIRVSLMLAGAFYLLLLAATSYFLTTNSEKIISDPVFGECAAPETQKIYDLPNHFSIYKEFSDCYRQRKHRYRYAISANPNLHGQLDSKSSKILVDGYINLDKAESNYSSSVSWQPENKITIHLPQNFVFLTTNNNVNGIELSILRDQ